MVKEIERVGIPVVHIATVDGEEILLVQPVHTLDGVVAEPGGVGRLDVVGVALGHHTTGGDDGDLGVLDVLDRLGNGNSVVMTMRS